MSDQSLIQENRERLVRIEYEVKYIKETTSHLSGKLENGISSEIKNLTNRVGDVETRTTNLENWRTFITRIHWTVFATGLAALLTTIGNLIMAFYK